MRSYRAVAAIAVLVLGVACEKSKKNNPPEQFTLTIAAVGAGTTDPVPGTYTYDEGEDVTVTATAADGSTFSFWVGDLSGTTASSHVVMNGDKTVTARFFTYSAEGSGLPAPGAGGVEPPSGDPGNLQVLNWAGYDAAVSYTFDDGLTSQTANYAALHATGVPFTFYINPRMTDRDVEAWQAIAADGNEIGNHTTAHCNVDSAGALTGCAWGPATASDVTEITTSNTYITETIGQDGVWTMASPFGDSDWDSRAQAAGFIIHRDVYAGILPAGDVTNQFHTPSYFFGDQYGGVGYDTADITAAVDDAVDGSGWGIFLFHAIGPGVTGNETGVDPEGCCEVPIENIVASIDYVKDLEDVWAGRMVDVGAYWIGQTLLADATPTTAGDVTTWRWTLPPGFPTGKFVRVTVDGGVLSQGGHELAWDEHGYYEVALDAGELTLAGASTGEDCILIAGTAQSQYGEIGISVDWSLTGATDFTGEGYTASVDVFVPASTTQPNLTMVQLPNAAYDPSYFGKYSAPATDGWVTLSFPITAAALSYGELLADSTHARFLFGTAAAADPISFCLKNFRVTNGTSTPLDFQVAAGGDYSGLYVATGTGVTITTVKR